MNRFYTLLAVVLLALAAPCRTQAAAPAPDDTIVVKLPNQATMTLFVKNKAQLRELRNYKLDSLMILLDTYITQAEAAGKTSKTETVTMEFYPAKDQPGKQVPEQIRVTVRTDEGKKSDTERVDVVLGRAFGVSVVENGDDDHVSIKVGTSAIDDSTRNAQKEAKQKERAARPGHSDFGIDIGLNALVNRNATTAEDFDLRPFGSRYISLNWHYLYRLGPQGSPVRLLTGPELSFNNYMFDNNARLFTTPTGTTVIQNEPNLDLDKSKLATTTINLPLMLVLNTKNKKGNDDGFRLGAGGFAGYRLGSRTKIKYDNDDRDRKDKDRGSFNLEDFNYGLQGLVGIGGLDLFVKYNLNELFKDGRGPQAQTLSFGVTLGGI